MIQRIKRIFELSKKDSKTLEVFDTLTKEQLNAIPEEGDGKAVFFGEGTESEYDDFQKEKTGLKGWYDRIKNL